MSSDVDKHLTDFGAHWQCFAQRYAMGAALSHTLYRCLQAAYQQPQRAYHSLQHINECMTLLLQVEHLLKDPFVVALALWFHDVVYDPQAPSIKSNYSLSNEVQSAELMQNICQSWLSTAQVQQVSAYIVATAQHAQVEDPDLKMLLDIDLAILATAPQRFAEYQKQIRVEYHWVDAPIYREKRAEVLRYFYKMQPLYQTEYFQTRFEQQAKINLAHALMIGR